MRGGLVIAFLLFVCFGLLLLRCTSSDPSMPAVALSYPDSLTLAPVDTLFFDIDEEVGFEQHSIHYNRELDVFSFFNEPTATLYLYRYSTQQLLEKIKYAMEGPDGLGNTYKMGHAYFGPDSIFFYQYPKGEFILADRAGKVKRRWIIDRDAFASVAPVDIRTLKPIVKVGEEIYAVGVYMDPAARRSEIRNVTILSLKDHVFKAVLPSPEIYHGGSWGNITQYQLFFTDNPNSGKLVYSFALDPYILEMDTQGNMHRHLLPSRYLPEVPEPMSDNPLDHLKDKERGERYDFTHANYHAILYDYKHGLYYRFASLKLSEEEYLDRKKGMKIQKPLSVIISDENFRKIGETALPISEGLYVPMTLITADGMLVGNEKLHRNNENKMPFTVFQPAAKQ